MTNRYAINDEVRKQAMMLLLDLREMEELLNAVSRGERWVLDSIKALCPLRQYEGNVFCLSVSELIAAAEEAADAE